MGIRSTFSESVGYKSIRQKALKNFDGSYRFFMACWRIFCGYVNIGAIDISISTPDSVIDEWLESIASELVNDSNSDFYIYG